MPKYPNITVKLIGENGTAYSTQLSNPCAISILYRVSVTMRAGKISEEEIENYLKEAKSGDYDHLLKVTMDLVYVK